MSAMTALCPHCRQPLPEHLDAVFEGLALSPMKRRIFEAVKNRPGIRSKRLRKMLWPKGVPPCRSTLPSHVWALNLALAPHGIAVRGTLGTQAAYRICAIGAEFHVKNHTLEAAE